MNLMSDKKAFDKILLDIPIDEFLEANESFNKYDFKEEYLKINTNFKYLDYGFKSEYLKNEFKKLQNLSSICRCNFVVIDKRYKDIKLPDNFWVYASINLFAYHLFTSFDDFKNIKKFLEHELNKDTLFLHIKKSIFIKYFGAIKLFDFFPALNWYLSDKTKHQYPKSLLKKMEKYEKELRNMKKEDYLITLSPRWQRMKVCWRIYHEVDRKKKIIVKF